MNKNQPDDSIHPKIEAGAASLDPVDETRTAGAEINVGDFTRTQGLMKSLRLLINNQPVVQVEDIASGVSDAGRKFKIGEIEQANLDVARLYAAFGQRTNQWENQARNLERQMKMQAAKNPKSISIDAMNRMKAEQTAVRTRIRTAEVHFRRLHQGLDQAFTNSQRRPVPMKSELPIGLPAEFVAALRTATVSQRAEIVKTFFDVEIKLTAHVTRSAKAGYDIRFDPIPPLGHFYFLTKTAQVIRLRTLSNVVVLQDVEIGQDTEIKLVEFVKHVQAGVRLLRPRPTA